MSETDRSKVKNLRGKVSGRLRELGCLLECMVTKCRDENRLKVAHILPDSTTKGIMNDLNLPFDFKNDTEATKWNFMVLRDDIEEAFDSLKISFMPNNLLEPEDFSLNIMDRSSLTPDIIVLEGSKLNVPNGIALSRRALSYQAYMAYIQAKYRDSDAQLAIPLDFSSEYDGKDQVRDRLARLVISSIHNEMLEGSHDE